MKHYSLLWDCENMTRTQFNKALQIALSPITFETIDVSILTGCGLPEFQPIVCQLETVAKFLRWQVVQFNGGVDNEELQNCYYSLVEKGKGRSVMIV